MWDKFRAIDHRDQIIEVITEGQKPLTLAGASQAYFAGFYADFKDYSIEELEE